MMRLSVVALCAALLTGCDFAGGLGDPVASVANTTLIAAPLDASGGWDPDGAPDLLVEVQDISGRAIYRSQVFENTALIPEGGLDLNDGFDVFNDFRSYYIVLIDVDPDGYELIAVSEAFNAEALANATDGTVTLGAPGDALQVVLQVNA